jgi:hypothetical protein
MNRLVLILLLLATTTLRAQSILVAPGNASFGFPANEWPSLASVHLDLFSCVSLSATGVCTTIPTPNVPGVDIPVSAITTLTTFLPDGITPMRQFSLTVPPASTALAALPSGQAYAATLTATGVSGTAYSGTSPRSNYTAPFFPVAGVPATPATFQLQP